MKALPLVACALLAIAAWLIFRGRGDKSADLTESSPGARASIRERAPRGTAVRDPISSGSRLRHEEQKSWIRSLSDAELRRITRAMIADYLAASADPALLPSPGETITPAEALMIISKSLHLLKLPQDSEAKALDLIERQLN